MSTLINMMSEAVPSWIARALGFSWWDWGDDRYDRHLTSEKVLTNPAIWYGTNKINKIAQFPIEVFSVGDERNELNKSHNVYKLFRRPNDYQTQVVYLEQFLTHSVIDGNGRSAIVRRGNRVMELIPMLPECTVTVMIGGMKLHATRPPEEDRLRLFFPTISDKYDENGALIWRDPVGIISLNDREVVHVPGLSTDGVVGLPLKKIGHRNIGAAIAAEERIARQFENGYTGTVVIELPPGLRWTDKDSEKFLEDWKRKHHKKEKAGEPALMREGMKLNIVQTSNKDAEMIENRKFQRQDMAMYLGLDWIHGDDSNAFASIVERNTAELRNTLSKYITKLEQEWESKLLPRREFDAGSTIIRMDTSEMLKADWLSTLNAAGQAVKDTLITLNEGREWINLNPVEGGDIIQNPQPGGGGIDSQNSQQDSQSGQASSAARAHIAHFIGVEANRVKEAAAKVGNFVSWLDNFYDKKWAGQFADCLETVGLDRDLATKHCEESKRRLLDIAGASTTENLAANVAKCVENWKMRANTLGECNV